MKQKNYTGSAELDFLPKLGISSSRPSAQRSDDLHSQIASITPPTVSPRVHHSTRSGGALRQTEIEFSLDMHIAIHRESLRLKVDCELFVVPNLTM